MCYASMTAMQAISSSVLLDPTEKLVHPAHLTRWSSSQFSWKCFGQESDQSLRSSRGEQDCDDVGDDDEDYSGGVFAME